MFYLMTHSTHFMYGYQRLGESQFAITAWKEGSVLFNDALNTFYVQL